jgi:hypothetical protein
MHLRTRVLAVVPFALLTAGLITPRTASACGGAVREARETDEVDLTRDALWNAERALAGGRYTVAGRYARRVLAAPGLEEGRRSYAEWIEAMSVIRDEDATKDELSWAVSRMRDRRARAKIDDVLAKADLGLALARLPSGEEEARSLLEPLAKADLIASEHAYATLAQIGGSWGTRFDAFQRCEGMTRDLRLCVRGYGRAPEHVDRWVARLSGVGGVFVLSAAALSAVLVAARLRRRTKAIAAFA